MIRGRIYQTLRPDGTLHTRIDWLDIDDNDVANAVVVGTEEFLMDPLKAGASYVTRGEFGAGTLLPGTFWVDAKGLRHFHLNADPGEYDFRGQDTAPQPAKG